MNNDQPLAYLITWTVYGTHLQGARTGWRKHGQGERPPQPRLESWRQQRLNFSILKLDAQCQRIVEDIIRQHCEIRGWHLWAVNARSNHVHVVVTAQCPTSSVAAFRRVDHAVHDSEGPSPSIDFRAE